MQTEVHHVKSDWVGDEFEVAVGRCCVVGERPRDILFVADSSISFGTAMDIAQILLLFGKMPPTLIVGLGYRAAHFGDTFEARTRDLTPTCVDGRAGSGGAPAFLEFIREELLPWLVRCYGVDPGRAAYWGHSLAGLFGAWVLLHKPSTFCRYGLSSPSVWWDEGFLFGQEARYAETHRDLDARVLITCGELEQPSANAAGDAGLSEGLSAEERAIPASAAVDMVRGARRFAAALSSRGYSSLHSELQVYPGETHLTASFLSLSRSLRYLWELPD